MVYVLVLSSATTAGMSSINDVRWLRAAEYSMKALKMGTGSIVNTLWVVTEHSTVQHSAAGFSMDLHVGYFQVVHMSASTHALHPPTPSHIRGVIVLLSNQRKQVHGVLSMCASRQHKHTLQNSTARLTCSPGQLIVGRTTCAR